MMKFNIDELKVMSIVDIDGVDIDDFDSSGVFKIELGSRGEVESVSRVEVIDGVFEVESKEELLNSIDEDSREELSEWVNVELWNGIVEVSISEEEGWNIVRVEK